MPNATAILSCIIFSIHVVAIQSQITTSNSSLCSSFNCGNINFSFPFSDKRTFGSGPINCGFPGYEIICEDHESSQAAQVPKLMLSTSKLYQVKNIFLNESDGVNLITVVDSELIRDFNTSSCQSLRNLTVPVSGINLIYSLGLPNWTTNLTFIKCPSQLEPSRYFLDQIAFNCSCSDEASRLYLWRSVDPSQRKQRKFDSSSTPRDCNLIMVPVSSADMIIMFNGTVEASKLTKALAAGFPLQWNSSAECDICKKTNGRCGFDGTEVVCICQNGCKSTK